MPSDRPARPTNPWVPDTLTVLPILRRTTKARPRGSGPEREVGKERPCWDVRWRVDGEDFFARFYRSAEASVFADELRSGRLQGLPFDPVAKRFKASEQLPLPIGDTVFSWTAEYWDQKWASLEPKSRSELGRYLNRTRSFFVAGKPTKAETAQVTEYLAGASLIVRTDELDEGQRAGEQWLRSHSLPLSEVKREQINAFLAHYRRSHRDPHRQTSPATERRMVVDLKQCWKRAIIEERLDVNPWDTVVSRTRSTRASARSTTTLAADSELVLSPDQVIELADRCVTEGSWGEHVRCYVLVMGLCGLRPNEAVGLLVGDIELPEEGSGWLTVRRTHRRVPERYLDPDEDPRWGPLKGRDLAATRRVPVPAVVAGALRHHLVEFCEGAAGSDLVFQHRERPFDLAIFSEDVWVSARTSMFPLIEGLDADSALQPKLARVRRHDLRHSACSMWLRAHIDVTVCQLWSGHKRLSVFLDVYQGLIPGRQEEGVRLLEEHLAVAL